MARNVKVGEWVKLKRGAHTTEITQLHGYTTQWYATPNYEHVGEVIDILEGRRGNLKVKYYIRVRYPEHIHAISDDFLLVRDVDKVHPAIAAIINSNVPRDYEPAPVV